MVLLFRFIIPTILSWEELQELFLPTLTRLQSEPWPWEIVINHPGFLLSSTSLAIGWSGDQLLCCPRTGPQFPHSHPEKGGREKKTSPDLKDLKLLLKAVLQALRGPWLSWGSKRSQGPGEGRGGIWVLLAAGEIIH